MKTLSICIPTYKRPEFLKRCMQTAIDAAPAAIAAGHLRIVVTDDSLTDINAPLMQMMCEQYSFVQWQRNQTNLGIDDNIQLAVDEATTDYAWLVGEDDLFLPGSVDRAYTYIQDTAAPFIFANYAYVGDTTTAHLGEALESQGADAVERDSFIAQHLWAVGFIGSCVIDRKAWITTDPVPFKGTYYTHVGRICSLMATQAQVPVLRKPLVGNRVEGVDTFTWKKDSYGVYFGFVQMCEQVAKLLPALATVMTQAHQTFEQRYRWLSVRLAMRLRSERGYDLAQYRKYLSSQPFSALKHLALRTIAVTPPGAFEPLVWLYRHLK